MEHFRSERIEASNFYALRSACKVTRWILPTRESYPAWVRQSFTFSADKEDVNDEYLNEIIEL